MPPSRSKYFENFSKVSALPNVLYTMPRPPTFEKFRLCIAGAPLPPCRSKYFGNFSKVSKLPNVLFTTPVDAIFENSLLVDFSKVCSLLDVVQKMPIQPSFGNVCVGELALYERWGAGVETQKNVREEIGGWGRVPFNEPYAPSLSTIYDGA